MTTLWWVTIHQLLAARADLVQQLEEIDAQLAVNVTLPDDPGVLALVAQTERMLGALAATTSSEELLAAHTVLIGKLVPGAQVAESQRTWPPQRRPPATGTAWTLDPGTGDPLPWGYWPVDLTNSELIALHTALGVLSAAADGTDEQLAAAALDRLIMLFNHGRHTPSIEAVDTVLALTRSGGSVRARHYEPGRRVGP